MTLPELVELLKTGGPYTLLIIAGFVIRHLHSLRDTDRIRYEAEKQALNDRIVKVVESQNEALARAIENQHRTSEVLARSVDNQQLVLEAVRSVQGKQLPHRRDG